MGHPGDIYTLPDGSQYILRTPGAEVGGEYVEFEWVFKAGTLAPPPHMHPSQVEEYEVLEGQLDVMIDGEWSTLRTGESASVPIGVNHTFRRPKEFVRVRNFHRPALGFEDFIASMARMGEERGVKRAFDPRVPLILGSAWKSHPETLVATRAPERIALGGAGAIAHAFGIR